MSGDGSKEIPAHPACPACKEPMVKSDLGSRHALFLYNCPACGEVAQWATHDGKLLPLTQPLRRLDYGEDRMYAAVSETHVTTLRNFLEEAARFNHAFTIDLGAQEGRLRALLAQIENRLDNGISILSELGFISDRAEEGLRYVREAREMVSPTPARQRGVRPERSA